MKRGRFKIFYEVFLKKVHFKKSCLKKIFYENKTYEKIFKLLYFKDFIMEASLKAYYRNNSSKRPSVER